MAQKSIIKSTRVLHACSITTIGFVALSYIMSYTSPIEDDLLNRGVFTINTYLIFGSTLNVGGLIGSIFAGPISQWIGIKTSLIIYSQLGMLGGMLLVLAYDDVSMIAGRVLIGLYTSMCQTCVPVYNAEVAPPSLKKFYGGVIGLAIRFGMLFSYTLGIWIGYRWLAVIYMIMIVFMNLNLVFLPESPTWLRNKGWMEKADEASEYFYDFPQENTVIIQNETDHSDNDVTLLSGSFSHTSSQSFSEISSISSTINPNEKLSQKIANYFIWPVWRPLLVCCSMQIFKTFSGHQYLLAYTAHTLDNAVGINPRIASLFYPVFLIIGAALFIWTIHKVNWKRLLLVTTFAQVLVNAIMGLTLYLSIKHYNCASNNTDIIMCEVLMYSPLLLIGLYGFLFSMGWGSLGWWVYGQLLHPYYIRISAGMTAFTFILGGITNQLTGPLIAEYFETYTLFFTYAIVCFVGFIIQLFY